MADELGSYQLVISELQALRASNRLCASTRLSASTKCEPTLCIVQRHLADEAGLLQPGQLKPHEWVSIELSAPNCWSIDQDMHTYKTPNTHTNTNLKVQHNDRWDSRADWVVGNKRSAKGAFVTEGKDGSIMSLLPKTNTRFKGFEGIIFTT